MEPENVCKKGGMALDETGNPRHPHLPHLGMRIIKSAVAVFLCMCIYELRGHAGLPFFSALAALASLQPYREANRADAWQRMVGTLLGGAFGLMAVLLFQHLPAPYRVYWVRHAMDAVLVAVVLYTAVALRQKSAALFSSIVYLCITMYYMEGDAFSYVFNRVVDTLIGLAVGTAVNALQLPRRKRKDVLFTTGLDHVLLGPDNVMSAYSRIEFNRLLAQGIPITIMTTRSPASFLAAAADIRLKLPVILMDGVVLYDRENNEYLCKREIPPEDAQAVSAFIRERGFQCFQTVVMGKTVLIYHQELQNPAEREKYDTGRLSPYRNFVRRPLPPEESVAYFSVLDKTEKVLSLQAALEAAAFRPRVRVSCQEDEEHPGYSSLRVYHRDATKENMLRELLDRAGLQKARTYGCTAGRYDVVVERKDSGDRVIRRLKADAEPLFLCRDKF